MPNFAINGFGRIGRNVLRAMSQKQVERVVAINDLTDTHTLAHLLKWDSVHGKFEGEIGYDDENIIVRGHKIKVLKERDPANLPWKKLDVDVVLESTGLFTSRDKAELHLSKAGAKRVLISAPAKDPDVTICIGVNDDVFDPAKDKIVSNASCTTNCLAPMAKVLNDKFAIAHGFMSTIHSYTNDQRILDFPQQADAHAWKPFRESSRLVRQRVGLQQSLRGIDGDVGRIGAPNRAHAPAHDRFQLSNGETLPT